MKQINVHYNGKGDNVDYKGNIFIGEVRREDTPLVVLQEVDYLLNKFGLEIIVGIQRDGNYALLVSKRR